MQFEYITTESLQKISGGWSGLNLNLFEGLSKKLALTYIQIPNPPISMLESRKSKLTRFLGLKGKYFMLSESRLNKFAEYYAKFDQLSTKKIFFGSMPWLHIQPKTEYYAITDISFMGYYRYYNKHNFSVKDIDRIANMEKTFFTNASKVFFTSEWAMNETKQFYDLKGDNFVSIGIAGNIIGKLTQSPSRKNFLYISQDFKKKGGMELFCAFEKLYKENNTLILNIIGGKPFKKIIHHPGVIYHGFLNKNNPDEKKKYTELLAGSSCLVLPTKSDAAPLTIIECGYFGTPTIAPKRFAIPEMVIPRKTGFLLNEHYTVAEISEKMRMIINMKQVENENLRKSTYLHFTTHNNWNKITTTILNKLYKKI